MDPGLSGPVGGGGCLYCRLPKKINKKIIGVNKNKKGAGRRSKIFWEKLQFGW